MLMHKAAKAILNLLNLLKIQALLLRTAFIFLCISICIF